MHGSENGSGFRTSGRAAASRSGGPQHQSRERLVRPPQAAPRAIRYPNRGLRHRIAVLNRWRGSLRLLCRPSSAIFGDRLRETFCGFPPGKAVAAHWRGTQPLTVSFSARPRPHGARRHWHGDSAARFPGFEPPAGAEARFLRTPHAGGALSFLGDQERKQRSRRECDSPFPTSVGTENRTFPGLQPILVF